MKVTVIKNKKNKQVNSLISSIVLLILGIFLTFNASGVLNTIFTILGFLVVLYGAYKFARYYQLKSQLKIDDSNLLMSAVISIVGGLLFIILSNFITSTIQILTGIWLLFIGINRLATVDFTNIQKQLSLFISAIVILILGLYTIFSENVVLIFIGIVLILYALYDIIEFIRFSK